MIWFIWIYFKANLNLYKTINFNYLHLLQLLLEFKEKAVAFCLFNSYNSCLLFFDRFKLRTELMQQAGENDQADKNKLEERKHMISSITWKEIKQRELNILEQECKIKEMVFTKIYQRHIDRNVLLFHFNLSLVIGYTKILKALKMHFYTLNNKIKVKILWL